MAFDGEADLRILTEILRLTLQLRLVFGIDVKAIGIEVNHRIRLAHGIDEMRLRTD